MLNTINDINSRLDIAREKRKKLWKLLKVKHKYRRQMTKIK